MPLVFLPQILWHSKDNKQCDRVYSLDFYPYLAEPVNRSTRTFKLATGGADEFVHIWEVSINENVPQYATHTDKSILAPENRTIRPGSDDQKGDKALQPFSVKVLARLVGHIGEVNAVRWNPNGIVLASGGEDRCIFLWSKTDKGSNILEGGNQDYEEHYSRFQYYRLSHVVNSISWCPEGRLLAVATEDGHISLVDTFVEGIGKIRHFEGHTSFAQGVSMCPKNILLASMGQDQTLRIWKRRNEKQWKSILILRSAKDQSDFKESIGMESDDVRYSRSVFMNEDLSTFFRRLDWSPDGRFLVTPAGVRHSGLFKKEEDPEAKVETSYTLYVFHRKLINRGLPMVTHQSPTGPFVVVKFCSLDLARIEKEKLNFFNRVFKTKGRSKKGKLPKAQKSQTGPAQEPTQTDSSAVNSQESNTQTGTAPEIKEEPEKKKEEATNPDEAFACDQQKEESVMSTDVPLKTEEPVSGVSIAITSVTTMKLEEDIVTKVEEPTVDPPQPKTEATSDIPETNATQDPVDINTLEPDASERIDTQCGNDALDNSTGADEGRTSLRTRREIKRPKFYETDVSIYKELSKQHKSKPSKKDEDKEYDTDAEDDVVIPRMMFAAGTLDGSLCFYDTGEDKGPIAVLKNLHYCAINDIAWSPDGLVCATASSDGYVTFVVFQKKDFY